MTGSSSKKVTAEGKYVKKFVKGMKQKGQYRGTGVIEVSESGIDICGYHVYSFCKRFLMWIGLTLLTIILTVGMFTPKAILLYLIVDIRS